jgi:hypothetical protein
MFVEDYVIKRQQCKLRMLEAFHRGWRGKSFLDNVRANMAALPLRDRGAVFLEAILADDASIKAAAMLLAAVVLLAHKMKNHERLAFAAQLVDEAERLLKLPRRELH